MIVRVGWKYLWYAGLHPGSGNSQPKKSYQDLKPRENPSEANLLTSQLTNQLTRKVDRQSANQLTRQSASQQMNKRTNEPTNQPSIIFSGHSGSHLCPALGRLAGKGRKTQVSLGCRVQLSQRTVANYSLPASSVAFTLKLKQYKEN